jgi:hypothetical protein
LKPPIKSKKLQAFDEEPATAVKYFTSKAAFTLAQFVALSMAINASDRTNVVTNVVLALATWVMLQQIWKIYVIAQPRGRHDI